MNNTEILDNFMKNLDSWKGKNSDEDDKLTFINYFPKSVLLNEKANVISMNKDEELITKETAEKMQFMNVENLISTGKINIYPKKNTIDLKSHFCKKMAKIQKKTQKAILHLAKELIQKQSK